MDVEKAVREGISKTIHMSLGTTVNDRPWVCEVHFVCDEGLNIYWMSYPSTRHSQEIEENEYVAGNIVRQHEQGEMPNGVYFEGVAAMLRDNEEVNRVAKMLIDRLDHIDDSIFETLEKADGKRIYKVTVENWYVFGKYDEARPKKYSLEWNKLDK